jgi:hypothetical protein
LIIKRFPRCASGGMAFAKGDVMNIAKLALGCATLALGLIAIPAHAQEDAVTSTAVPTTDIAVRGYALGFGNDQAGGGALGGMMTLRTGLFEIGGFGEGGTALLDYDYTAMGGVAGVAWRSEDGIRLAALGTAGSHHYRGFDRGFLSNDPGANAAVPFAGGRVLASYRLWGKLDVGLMGLAERDLKHETVRYSYTSESWFGGGSSQRSEAQDVGTTSYGFGLQVGSSLDL